MVPAIPAYLRYLRPHLRHSHRMNSSAIVFESHTRVYPVHTCDPTCVIYTATPFSRNVRKAWKFTGSIPTSSNRPLSGMTSPPSWFSASAKRGWHMPLYVLPFFVSQDSQATFLAPNSQPIPKKVALPITNYQIGPNTALKFPSNQYFQLGNKNPDSTVPY